MRLNAERTQFIEGSDGSIIQRVTHIHGQPFGKKIRTLSTVTVKHQYTVIVTDVVWCGMVYISRNVYPTNRRNNAPNAHDYFTYKYQSSRSSIHVLMEFLSIPRRQYNCMLHPIWLSSLSSYVK